MKQKKLTAIILMVSMLFTCISPVYAKGDQDKKVLLPDTYEIEDTTYYNTKSDQFDRSTKLFIEDLLTEENGTVLPGEFHPASAVSNWQSLATLIQNEYGEGTKEDRFKPRLNEALYLHANAYRLKNMKPKNDCFGEYKISAGHKGSDKYAVMGSGLNYAGSVKRAAEDMEDRLFKWYSSDKIDGGREDQYTDNYSENADDVAVRKNEELRQDTDKKDSFWMLTGAFKTTGLGRVGHYQALGIIFSDFKITTILPEDNEKYFDTKTNESDGKNTSKTYASNVKNLTGVPIEAKQGIVKSITNTASSEINGSNSYSFEEHVNAHYEHKTWCGGKFGSDIGFTAGQVIENGWAEKKSCQNTVSSSYDVTVDLPPYTNIMLKQTDTSNTSETVYDCPVALNYKVTVVEYTLDPSKATADCKTRILATFGGNARKDLMNRAVTEKTLTDPDHINWEHLENRFPELSRYIIPELVATVPMSSAGAKFIIDEKSVNSEIDSLQPIYPLELIKTAEEVEDYHMTVGDKLYLDNIELEGINDHNGAYYGFHPKYGRWVLTDKNGKVIKDSKIAKIKKNANSKATELICGERPGTVYLKYLIDEDRYDSVKHPEKYATNDSLTKTATIKVMVSEKPFTEGTVKVSGSLTGIAGDPYKSIEGTEGFTVNMEDATGKEVSRSVEWDAKELPRRGIQVKNNQIRFTKPGTFHIRATAGSVRSDWYEVTALPERKLSKIVIPSEASLDCRMSSYFYLPNLTVTYLDQYGDPWKETPKVTWKGSESTLQIDGDYLNAPGVGTYTLRAECEGIVSNPVAFTVIDTSARLRSPDPDIFLTINQVDSVIHNKTSSLLYHDKKTDLVKYAHNYMDISAIKNGVMVENFTDPIQVIIPMTDSCRKEIKDPSKLVLAQILQNKKGEVRLDYVGGRYDAKNKVFRAKIDDTGNYVFVEKEDVNKIVLTIGNRTTYYNDQPKVLDVAPKIINGRTMVPLRYIGEAIGCEVKWNGDERSSITIHKDKRTMKIKIDEEIPKIGVAPVIVNNRTLAPIRYISEFLGANVIFDPAIQEIIINP